MPAKRPSKKKPAHKAAGNKTAIIAVAAGPVTFAPARTAAVERRTKETFIAAEVNLDGTGRYEVSTGIGGSRLGSR